MTYEGIEFTVRAGLGRNEWTLLEPFVTQANGSRDDAIAVARKRIDTWFRRQRRRALVNSSQ